MKKILLSLLGIMFYTTATLFGQFEIIIDNRLAHVSNVSVTSTTLTVTPETNINKIVIGAYKKATYENQDSLLNSISVKVQNGGTTSQEFYDQSGLIKLKIVGSQYNPKIISEIITHPKI